MVDIRHLRKIEKQIHNNKDIAESESATVKPPVPKEKKADTTTDASVPPVRKNTKSNKSRPVQSAQPRANEKSAGQSAAKTLPEKTEKPAETSAGKESSSPAQAVEPAKETKQAPIEDSHQVETRELVTFKLDGRYFGIYVDLVHSVVKPTEITRVPKLEDYLKGIMNLRGIITPVYDLKRRFEIGETEILTTTRIIILEMQNNLVGFMVDEIADLYHIQEDSIMPPPEMLQDLDRRFIMGVVAQDKLEELILILALDEIVDHINFRETN